MHCAHSTSKRRSPRCPAVGVASFGGKDCSVATAAGGPSRARRCSDGGVNAAADGIHRVDGPVLRCAHGAAKRNGAVGGRSQCTERNGVPASSRATAISCAIDFNQDPDPAGSAIPGSRRSAGASQRANCGYRHRSCSGLSRRVTGLPMKKKPRFAMGGPPLLSVLRQAVGRTQPVLRGGREKRQTRPVPSLPKLKCLQSPGGESDGRPIERSWAPALHKRGAQDATNCYWG